MTCDLHLRMYHYCCLHAAHLLGGDGVQAFEGQHQPVDHHLVRQLVADALLEVARRHVHMPQTEEKEVGIR